MLSTERAISKGSLVERRASMLLNKVSASMGLPRNCTRATARAPSRRVSDPSGNSCISVSYPCVDAAICISARKQPSPMVSWRSKGSVSGSLRPGSTSSVTTPGSCKSTIQGCRLCGLGARIAYDRAWRRGSAKCPASCQGASAALGVRLTAKPASPVPAAMMMPPPTVAIKRRRDSLSRAPKCSSCLIMMSVSGTGSRKLSI